MGIGDGQTQGQTSPNARHMCFTTRPGPHGPFDGSQHRSYRPFVQCCLEAPLRRISEYLFRFPRDSHDYQWSFNDIHHITSISDELRLTKSLTIFLFRLASRLYQERFKLAVHMSGAMQTHQ